MADFPLTENPEFNSTMRKLETTDLAHADTFNPGYQTLLNNDNYLKKETERLKGIRYITIPVSDWSADAPYIQIVQAEGITDIDTPIISIYFSEDVSPEEVKSQSKAYGCLDRAVTGNGTIMAYCYNKKPEVDFRIQVKGV